MYFYYHCSGSIWILNWKCRLKICSTDLEALCCVKYLSLVNWNICEIFTKRHLTTSITFSKYPYSHKNGNCFRLHHSPSPIPPWEPKEVFSLSFCVINMSLRGFPAGSVGRVSASNAVDPGSIPGSGRSPEEGNDNPFLYSCLENFMDRGAWWTAVHGVTKSRTGLSN